ncbi:putative baseplate assembly protein [Methanosarcina sp. Z-7115]|uniref:Baseplate assembly protein n=1 Tax=Methanosarcina baikalica TaxID=3073890 RepID=A0ABU2CYN7_9EURY|nr:putative baseplate assembly protein [Methanosarcina sp. Z-7115]MDR7664839.1 putative baseplate assembly protein [Methanosarcina sp. Z-7115]
MERKTPKIRETTADTVLEKIQKKAPFYVPEWTPGAEGDFGNALSRIFADMAENLLNNLNEAPRKHLLSFLDMLNFSLSPARPASTVLCFVPVSKAPENVTIPAKTRVTAKSPDGETLFFETEKTFAITPSKLCFVCSLDRERDAIFDHSSTVDGTEPSTLLSGTNMQKHAFYIGDEEFFRSGKGKISFTLTAAGAVEARMLAEENMFVWEYAAPASGNEKDKMEITEWFSFSAARFSGEKFEILKGEEVIGKGKINGLESRWIRCRLKGEGIKELEQFFLGPVKVDVSAEGIKPDFLFYNDIPLEDGEAGVQPFGSKPILYDTFYIACSEAFSRQGSEVLIDFYLKPGRPGLISKKPVLSWEYWSGESWRSLKKYMDFSANIGESEEGKSGSEGELPELELENFLVKNIIETEAEMEAEKEPNGIGRLFISKEKEDRKKEEENLLLVHVNVKIREMPPMAPGSINGEESYWIRVRLIEGIFGKECGISKKNSIIPGRPPTYEIEPEKFYPPEIRKLIFSYSDRNGREPDYLVSENNLAFVNRRKELKRAGSFKPFETVSEPLPAVYLGFTSKFVKGPLSLFIKLEETFVDQGVPVKFEWQYLVAAGKESAGEWKELQVLDETGGLAKSGILEFFVPEEMKTLQCYGSKSPLYWIRFLFTEGKRTPRISGLYPNCIWALQAKTVKDEILGSGFRETGQELELRNRPVVDAEVWVNEVDWLSEGEKEALLNKNGARDVKTVKDSSDRILEFWVRWEKVADFSSSDGRSRHYLLDRTSGKIRFGNGIRGMIPPLGMNNIKASYRTGGGEAGNLTAFSIKKLYSSLKHINAVYNPAASEGGARTESLEELVARAPATFKHRGRAVNREDIICFTKEASQKVAKVKVLSGSDEEGNRFPGLMTVVIVPDLPEQKPAPTAEILQIVEAHLNEKTPNIGKLKVAGPVYYEVSVRAELVTTDLEALSEIENRVKSKVEEFLHPLKGGKKGEGWDFGQIPSTSDFYSLLSDLNGISYVRKIDFIKAENETPEKQPRPSALPCNGKHEINLLWKAEKEE